MVTHRETVGNIQNIWVPALKPSLALWQTPLDHQQHIEFPKYCQVLSLSTEPGIRPKTTRCSPKTEGWEEAEREYRDKALALPVAKAAITLSLIRIPRTTNDP